MHWRVDDFIDWIVNGCDLTIAIRVTSLSISHQRLTIFPDEIGKLTNLLSLDCAHNNFTELPPIIGHLVNLTVLRCGHNRLCRLPNEIGKLVKLRILDCSHNPLTKMPTDVGGLVNLGYLSFSCCFLSYVPTQIGQLVNLRCLVLDHNQLTSLPYEIGNLIKLEVMKCSFNKLTSLPTEIGNLVNLITIDLNSNQIKKLPNTIDKLVQLASLNINHNQFKSFPIQICNNIRLVTLSCSYNPFLAPFSILMPFKNRYRGVLLPPDIKKLENLEYLFICGTNLSALPTLECFPRMKMLDCSKNNLKSLPDSICSLLQLTCIRCSENNIITLPNDLDKLINLVEMRFDETTVNNSPNVIRHGRRQIINNTDRGVYDNKQSVHDDVVIKSIKKSISHIMTIKPIYTYSQINAHLQQNNYITEHAKTLIRQYTESTAIHSKFHVTFEHLFVHVYSLLLKSDYCEEISKILSVEIVNAEKMCLTGILGRLVSCLVGYVDGVDILISDNDQLSNVILQTKVNLVNEGTYTTDMHKKTATANLAKMGYTTKQINDWMQYIE